MRASEDDWEREPGWSLSGQDGQGDRIELFLSESDLQQAYLGVTVGRHAQLCERVLSDPSVSRRHFRLAQDASGLLVEDVNSLNGTLLDGEAIRPFHPVALQDGDHLTVGRVELTVRRIGDDD